MEKIDTDYKQQNWKVKLNFLNPFNRDVAPLNKNKLISARKIKTNNKTKQKHLQTKWK